MAEVNIGEEPSKSGFTAEDLYSAVEEIEAIKGVRLVGLMAIPPICEQPQQNIPYFDKMYKLFIDISGKRIDNISMDYLSMGMSGDFEQAIESGANIIRLGTVLFGQRNYN